MTETVSLVGEGISRGYGRGGSRKVALDVLDISLTGESSLGIVGESGSGKSTLIRMMGGLLEPSSGTVRLDGEDVSQLLRTTAGRIHVRSSVQLVSQDTTASFDPRRTMAYSLAEPLKALRIFEGDEATKRIQGVLDMLGLPRQMLVRRPGQLSGGQRQRFALARALVVRPRMLLCDEVVSALDVSVQGEVLNNLKDYCTTYDVGLCFVSHGLPATAFLCRDLAVMRFGRVVEFGNTPKLLNSPQTAYTAALLSAYDTSRSPQINEGISA